jgi:hypothetical protein
MSRILFLLVVPALLFACSGEETATETLLLEGPALVMWYTDN